MYLHGLEINRGAKCNDYLGLLWKQIKRDGQTLITGAPSAGQLQPLGRRLTSKPRGAPRIHKDLIMGCNLHLQLQLSKAAAYAVE